MSSPDSINPTAASLLGFLHTGPMTGWELDVAVAGSIANFWNVTRSQVYRELRTLAELGYVEAEDAGPRDRRPHAITDAGREVFAAWIVRHPGAPIVRLPLLLSVFFGSHIPPDRLAEIVNKELADGMDALEHFHTLQRENRSDPFVTRVLDFGIAYQKTLLSWLQELADRPPQPADGDPNPDTV